MSIPPTSSSHFPFRCEEAEICTKERFIRLHYRLHGRGKEKVIFVMGFGTTCSAWQPQVEYFETFHSNEFQVCIFDNRGVGKSSCPKGRYRTCEMAQDVVGLANHLGWKKFHLVGISMGGMISLELACRFPERLLSLSLAVTHAGGINSVVPVSGFSIMLKLWNQRDPTKRAVLTMPMIYSQNWLNQLHPSGKTNLEIVSSMYEEKVREEGAPPLLGILRQMSAIATHYVSPSRLKRMEEHGFPIMICTGTNDHLVRPKNSFLLKEILTSATFHIFEGAGHAVNMECKDTFNRALLENFRKGKGLSGERKPKVLSMIDD